MGTAEDKVLGQVVGTNGTRALCLLDIAQLAANRSESTHASDNTSIGAIVRISVRGSAVFCGLVDLAQQAAGETHALAELEYLGEGVQDPDGALTGFRRGVSHFPQPGDPARFASEDELARIFAPPDLPHIPLGTVYPTRDVRAPVLFDALLSRHFAIVGSSGAGKSTTVALLLDRIVGAAATATSSSSIRMANTPTRSAMRRKCGMCPT